MPRTLMYYHLLKAFGLKPAEVDALDHQVLEDFFTIARLERELKPTP